MAGLKEIRTRIASVKTTRQVTSAMKMVSAAKLKKAQDAILQIRPYADKLHQILTSLSASLENVEDSVYTQNREPEKVLVVLITSNRGLCGGFNANISKNAVELAKTKYLTQLKLGKLDFICIGKQGARQMGHRKMNIIETKNEIFDSLTFENVFEIEAILSPLLEGNTKSPGEFSPIFSNIDKTASVMYTLRLVPFFESRTRIFRLSILTCCQRRDAISPKRIPLFTESRQIW